MTNRGCFAFLPTSGAQILVRFLVSPDSEAGHGKTQRPNSLLARLLLLTVLFFKLLWFKLLVIFLGCWEESILILCFDKVSSDQL